MNKFKLISLTASLVLAITFTLSCSGDNDDGGNSSSSGGGGSSSSVGGDGSSSSESGIAVPGTGLVAKLLWISNNAVSNTDYIVNVTENEAIAPQTLSYPGKTGITINLKGPGYVISPASNGRVFEILAGVTLVLENITLDGGGTNTTELVYVRDDGTLIMKDGAKIKNNLYSGVHLYGYNTMPLFVMDGGEITDNIFSSDQDGGGGVLVRWGKFVMNGGLIARNKCNNTINGGGGIYVYGESATFTMNGGKISDNTVYHNNYGGGVLVIEGTFTMTGGEISGNKVMDDSGANIAGEGGGVANSGTFIMSGGIIARNSAGEAGGVRVQFGNFEKTASGGIIYGNDGGENANVTANAKGNAIYVYFTNIRRDNTVGASERLYCGNDGTYEGNWIKD